MRETPDAGRKRIDLSVPQVAGSALAAVVAAKLASYFGVYGTILGAGVVSAVATCGGTLFQHFFRRTGEQLREATVAARPRDQVPPAPGEFTEGTVYRARVRKTWRRPVVAAALVFGVTMAGITTYELVSGNSFSGGTGTTVSDAVTGRGSSASTPDAPGGSGATPVPSDTPSRGRAPDAGAGTAHSATPAPAHSPSGEPGGGPSPSPTPTPSGSTQAPTTPEPSASSRSGTAVPGQGGPSAR
ncbi:hypothetical protein FB563_0923 [Streptomyces puniciscabiei]|uniref:Uncharacterized protein n=1 Tax=Streptomyces puniciscabiei TaxID=164348 RepID=A0A542UA95_9ACTN|nr:hypothetical protein [Streptomyces puniciscabiei]TQK95996.1 hypothetical protein FB563_0923 [Streptomyces puniciscabiei]